MAHQNEIRPSPYGRVMKIVDPRPDSAPTPNGAHDFTLMLPVEDRKIVVAALIIFRWLTDRYCRILRFRYAICFGDKIN